MTDIKVTTDRLDLIAATVELAQTETGNRAQFSRLLETGVPRQWPLECVVAQTFLGLAPSVRVLEKSGFVATVAEGAEDGVIRFELMRSAFGPG